MTPEERAMIRDLFGRIGKASAETNDPEAERLIRDEVTRNPNAPYVLVQTVLLQEEALRRADERIRELQDAAQGAVREPASFLGSGQRAGDAVPRGGSVPNAGIQPRDPASLRSSQRWPGQSAGGGFLNSALSTATGVLGGMLLADSIRSLFGGGTAEARPTETDKKASSAEEPLDAQRQEAETAEETYHADYDEGESGWDDGDSMDI